MAENVLGTCSISPVKLVAMVRVSRSCHEAVGNAVGSPLWPPSVSCADSSRQREPPCFGELLVELYGLVEGFFELLLGLAVGGPIAVLHGGLAVFHGLGGIVQCLLEFGTASGAGLPG